MCYYWQLFNKQYYQHRKRELFHTLEFNSFNKISLIFPQKEILIIIRVTSVFTGRIQTIHCQFCILKLVKVMILTLLVEDKVQIIIPQNLLDRNKTYPFLRKYYAFLWNRILDFAVIVFLIIITPEYTRFFSFLYLRHRCIPIHSRVVIWFDRISIV